MQRENELLAAYHAEDLAVQAGPEPPPQPAAPSPA
jgi:hypothetical protein